MSLLIVMILLGGQYVRLPVLLLSILALPRVCLSSTDTF